MPTKIDGQPEYIGALIYDGIPKWTNKDENGTTVVTYSFMTQVPSYYPENAKERTNFVALTSTQQTDVRNAMDFWERVANVRFIKVSDEKDGGEIRLGTAEIKVPDTNKDGNPILDKDGNPILVVKESAHASAPGKDGGGDLWLNNAFSTYANSTPGSFDFYTLLHELGHTLGLSHPGPYNAGNREDLDAYKEPNNYLEQEKDNWQYSVMSYNDGQNGRSPYFPPGGVSPRTPLLYDIAAIQYLYGANTKAALEDNTYNQEYFGGRSFLAAIWDAGGNDTIDASVYFSDTNINLESGEFSSIGGTNNLAIANSVTIENAIGGAGNDTIRGNAVANDLRGGGGNDTLYSYDGNDSLWGEDGNDELIGFWGNDTLFGGAGEDLLKGFSEDDYLAGGIGDDWLDGSSGNDQLYGEANDDTLIGREGSDSLYGGEGDDYLDGGSYVLSEADRDTLNGGRGSDTYVIGNDHSIIQESFNSGETDTVQASISYTLGANLENLTLVGIDSINGSGNELDNNISGNDFANLLNGNLGKDTLAGGKGKDTLDGGAGNDSMNGGAGDDSYTVDRSNDVVTELPNEGSDIIYASANYTLRDNIEELIFTGNAAVDGIGNDSDNTITGNAANNLLSGMGGNDTLTGGEGDDTLDGGSGIDLMAGGLGDDSYAIDSNNDQIIENEGTDTVNTSISYVLSGNLENLNLTGVDAINGTGNNLNNTINGNDAVNYIYAGSGADLVNSASGDDYVYGEDGDDLIFGGNGSNNLNGGLGNDVISGDKGQDWLAGDLGNDELIGGAGADHLIGGMGKDTLIGGIGKDWLTGGMGADRFTFRSRKHGTDIITDFRISDRDQIVISAKGFSKKLKIGKLSGNQFALGSAATDTNDRFIYDSSTGSLFFDKDGIGNANQMHIATLSKGLSLSNRNISIIA